jgi:hypothetical protein
MSFHTVFVLVPKDGSRIMVAPQLDASEALSYFQRYGVPGEVYACKLSEAAAAEVRETQSLKMTKMYSHSMQKCADVT